MKKVFLIMVSSLLLLTGCWDQRQFKNVKLVLSAGFDAGEDGQIIQTVSIPTVRGGESGTHMEAIQTLTTQAPTPLAASDKMDRMVENTLNPAKIQVYLLGEELAKQSMYPVLDAVYRNPSSNLNAHLVVVEGEAKEAVEFKSTGITKISEYISGIISASAYVTHSSGENLQMLCAELVEPGQDFLVPLIKVDSENGVVKFSGLGLMYDDRYTGEKIEADNATMLMLLLGNKGNVARMTKKVGEYEKEPILDYVTFNVINMDRKMKVRPKGEQIDVDVNLKLDVRVTEYPHDHLVDEKVIDELSKKLSKALTKDSEEIMAKLQESNSDVFGIGRRIKAFHPDLWGKLDWTEKYKEVNFNPNVEVTIQQHGIVN
ncbi:Ger(x)C family spore germination protein [Halobacillus sp. Marseille-Q1614]|uniref:Ger(x)C family spore germination protein n=1 Tax=Halobacillus sp. Marseille-Q1614 TaxID=2709134 RepID=UPI0015704077|nr:Ger(x)C family spore germination protein [Halobacillus sp. Marseille-Q1614]